MYASAEDFRADERLIIHDSTGVYFFATYLEKGTRKKNEVVRFA